MAMHIQIAKIRIIFLIFAIGKQKKCMGNLITEDWGLIDYAHAWERQETLFNQRLEQKVTGELETVDRIIEAAGNTIDIKFGVSINPQLTDQILVSVIASDFTEDFDFTVVPTYEKPNFLNHQTPVAPKADEQAGELNPNRENDNGEEGEEVDDFLPSFLKGKNID